MLWFFLNIFEFVLSFSSDSWVPVIGCILRPFWEEGGRWLSSSNITWLTSNGVRPVNSVINQYYIYIIVKDFILDWAETIQIKTKFCSIYVTYLQWLTNV